MILIILVQERKKEIERVCVVEINRALGEKLGIRVLWGTCVSLCVRNLLSPGFNLVCSTLYY